MQRIRRIVTSVQNALVGIVVAYRQDLSFRTHVTFTLPFLIVFVLVVEPQSYELYALMITYGLVLIAELFNTSLETLLNRLHPDRHEAIANSKDIAAGAVLIAYVVLGSVLARLLWDHALCCLGGHV